MKHPAQALHRSLFLAGLAAFPFILSLPVNAQNNYSWDGGGASNTWGTVANWVGDPATVTFGTNTNLTFNNLTRATDNELGNPRTVRSLTFGADIDSSWLTNFRSSGPATSRDLTMQSASGNATITVDAGASGNINLGFGSGSGGANADLVLGSNLDIIHNGSGNLTFSRRLSGANGFTKSGSGTMISLNTGGQAGEDVNTFTGAANFNGGRAIFANTVTADGDLNTASAVNLGGGILEIRTSTALNKTLTSNTTVSASSTLVYNNTAATDQSLTVSTGSLTLNAALTVENISSSVAGNNLVNISRAITGSGDVVVKTYNSVATSGANFSLGRVQLSGNNSGWSGNLVVSQGTAQISGANSTGTGDIFIGETASSLGAGLGLNTSGDPTYSNDIVVRSGSGLRAIKNNTGTTGNTTFSGTVTLNGSLTVDHNLLASGQSMTFSGNISGVGGLNITRSIANNGSAVVLSGTNTYTGDTNVTSGALLFNGSATSSITVDGSSRFGGSGSTTGNLSFASGSLFVFSPTASFTVGGSLSLAASFGVASLVNADGTAINWSGVGSGVYTLISAGGTFSGINNYGLPNAFDLGDGRAAYFQNTGLELFVGTPIPEPGSFALFGGLGAMAFVGMRRRRR